MFNAVIVLVMLGIIISLGSGLVFLVRDEGKTNRTVASLAIRVGLSVVLLVLLAVGFAAKYLTPAA